MKYAYPITKREIIVSNLIEGLNRKGYKVIISDFERIVAEDNRH